MEMFESFQASFQDFFAKCIDLSCSYPDSDANDPDFRKAPILSGFKCDTSIRLIALAHRRKFCAHGLVEGGTVLKDATEMLTFPKFGCFLVRHDLL